MPGPHRSRGFSSQGIPAEAIVERTDFRFVNRARSHIGIEGSGRAAPISQRRRWSSFTSTTVGTAVRYKGTKSARA